MSIKSIAHLAHQRLASITGVAFKRAHFYELMAAAFSYKSYAAMVSESVLFSGEAAWAIDASVVGEKSRSLGYDERASELIAAGICDELRKHGVAAIRLADLVQVLRKQSRGEDWEANATPIQAALVAHLDDSDFLPEAGHATSILLEGLRSAAGRDSGEAHYAMALLHEPSRDVEFEPTISPYWHQQRLKGEQLSGVQIEWADAYVHQEAGKATYERHLREAARLKCGYALLDLAVHFGDSSVFEHQIDLSEKDPDYIAELAGQLGRHDDARRYLTIAAEGGSVEAMRGLIDDYDSGDIAACWKWVYLAKHFGADLTQDDYRAIHEDGSSYDDDVGGPMYADGRDGVDLAPLPAEVDRHVRRAAQEIYARIEVRKHP